MKAAVRDELSRLWSVPAVIFYVAFLALPTVQGLLLIPSYAYEAPIDNFTLMTNGPIALVFPLLLTGLYVFRLSGLLNHRYAFYARFRSSTSTFLAAHIIVNAVVVGVLVLASYLLAAAVAFLILPSSSYLASQVGYQPLPADQIGGYTTQLITFSQLAFAGVGVYVVVFSLFVAVFSTVIATASLGFTLLAKSRILGLAASLILYTVENFVLAYARLEQYRTVTAIFPDAISPQPLWVPMIPLAAWIVLTVVVIIQVRRSADQLETLA
ncbi:MAG: hypothetical protein QM650_18505 [Microlunatus sp.]